MSIKEFFDKLIVDAQLLRWQEWLSVIFQIASVWFARKNKIWVYPTGIIGVLLAAYMYLFVSQPPIYADGVLQIYFFIMSVLGWYFWTRKKDKEILYPISYCNAKEWILGLLIGLISFCLIYLTITKFLPSIFSNFQKSDTVILDSMVSSLSITGMWWMAKRKIENWWAWILVNCFSIPLNLYKGFVLFAVMYVLFIILAVMGGLKWMKEAKQN